MALNKVPAITPPLGARFCAAAFLAVFIFFFTKQEPTTEQTSGGQKKNSP